MREREKDNVRVWDDRERETVWKSGCMCVRDSVCVWKRECVCNRGWETEMETDL